jgi:gamma-glutamyltranspeptidase/glutathione hydrolase
MATFAPNGRAPKIGEKFTNEAQARTLERIAESKGEAFYRGDLAEKIAAHAKNTGGQMTEEDLAEHQADWVDTITTDFRDHTLHEIPPNGQGIAALITLGILEHLDLTQYPVDSADSYHLQFEAMKLAYVDTHRYVSDPNTRDIEYEPLLDSDYFAKRAKLIDLKKAQSPTFGIPSSDTVYLTAADENGMMVSFIQSNYMGFGSGIVIPDTGISMQNRGAGFSLKEGHPNRVDGGKRPYHTIIPAFATKDGQPIMSFGVMGGHMQPQGHAQMMIRIFAYGQNPQTACDAPRWQVFGGLNVGIEPGVDTNVLDDLRSRGHSIEIPPEIKYGGGQLIYKLDDGYCAASDPRKDGLAVGY